jgi:DNA-binding NarL/FixJ family response regulator
LNAIKAVADGGMWVDPKVIQLLADQLIDRYPPYVEIGQEKVERPLADRERNVLLGILGGLSNRKIGYNLGISESSVKNVVQRLFTRSGVKTRSQLVRTALEGTLGVRQEILKTERDEESHKMRGQGRRINRTFYRQSYD